MVKVKEEKFENVIPIRKSNFDRLLEQAKEGGKAEAKLEFKKLIDSKTIECNLAFGQWWMNLEQLKSKLKEKDVQKN